MSTRQEPSTVEVYRREVGLIHLAGADDLVVAILRRTFTTGTGASSGAHRHVTVTPTAVEVVREPEIRPGEPGSMLPAKARELAAVLLLAATAAEALDHAEGLCCVGADQRCEAVVDGRFQIVRASSVNAAARRCWGSTSTPSS